MAGVEDILVCFEVLDPEGIHRCISQGVDPCMLYKGQPLVYQLVTMYSRGDRFRVCMEVMEAHGAVVEDVALQAVLKDDGVALERMLQESSALADKRYNLPCAFTPLDDVTLLHIAVEYGHRDCAGLLVQYGAHVDATAGIDVHGFGGQTPVFHAVNQYRNFNVVMLEFLLAQGARLDITLPGLIWGKGFAWETFIPSVNPISYAMIGLLRQFQRVEADVYVIVDRLMRAQYGIEYQPENLPNRYLQ